MPCQVPSASFLRVTGTCSDTPFSIAFTCAGMSSGPSASWIQFAFSGASIGILLNRQRSRGVPQKDQQHPLACSDAVDKASHVSGNIDKAIAPRIRAQGRTGNEFWCGLDNGGQTTGHEFGLARIG